MTVSLNVHPAIKLKFSYLAPPPPTILRPPCTREPPLEHHDGNYKAASGPGPGRSRGQRSTSPIATALSTPSHMQRLAPFWTEIPTDVQIKLARIPFDTVKAGLREAEKTADRRATKLAEDEYNHRRHALVRIADGLDASISELEASAAAKIAEARALKPRARSAHAATAAEDKAHAKQVGHLNSEPRTSASTSMDSPPPRQRVTAAAAIFTRPFPADSWAAVTSRTHPAPPHTTAPPFIDDAYLDIRVSTYRFYNENYPADIKDQIYDLLVAVYAALDKMNHGKVPLRLVSPRNSAPLAAQR